MRTYSYTSIGQQITLRIHGQLDYVGFLYVDGKFVRRIKNLDREVMIRIVERDYPDTPEGDVTEAPKCICGATLDADGECPKAAELDASIVAEAGDGDTEEISDPREWDDGSTFSEYGDDENTVSDKYYEDW